MIVGTIFFLIMNQMEFRLVHNQKQICYYIAIELLSYPIPNTDTQCLPIPNTDTQYLPITNTFLYGYTQYRYPISSYTQYLPISNTDTSKTLPDNTTYSLPIKVSI